jgi:hypothetical protein
MRNERQSWKLWWWIIIPLTLATLKVILHHASLDFGFKEINRATSPFFRNHVNYAAILALILPMLRFFWGRYRRWTMAWWTLAAAASILFFGVLTAYTRAAYVALFLAAAMYFVIKLRLIRWALLGAVLVVPIFFGYMIYNNKFMDFAPSERTVSHVEFSGIVAATYKMEDVSTSERYYRWIAGIHMTTEHPISGVGPGKAMKFGKAFIELIAKYVEENEIDRPTDFVLKSVANKGTDKIKIIQAIDKRISIDEIAKTLGMKRGELINEIESIVNSGTKVNIDYYLNSIIDEELIEYIFEYFKNSETESLDAAADEFKNDDIEIEDLQLARIKFMSEMAN